MSLKRVRCTAPGIRVAGRDAASRTCIRTAARPRRLRSRGSALASARVERRLDSPIDEGHLQAVGTDAGGSSTGTDAWRACRDRQRSDRRPGLAHRLPAMRRVCQRDIAVRGLMRGARAGGRAPAARSRFFRVGSEAYTEENGSFGLATLRRSHAKVSGDEVRFDFAAKGGQRQVQWQAIHDPDRS